MSYQGDDVSWLTKKFSLVFMRVMFSAVHGWKKKVPVELEYIQVEGCDGSTLEGAIRQADTSAPKGVVLLCHPFLKYGMHYFFKNGMDQSLTSHGFDVISFNFKGFGRSNIRGHAFYEDIFSATNYIKQRYPDLPIFLLGCSFGGFHLSHALARNSKDFTSVVLDSVPCSVSVYFKQGLLSLAMNWISKSKLGDHTGTTPIKGSLATKLAIFMSRVLPEVEREAAKLHFEQKISE